MIINLKESEIKTLKKDELNFWSYNIKTKFGNVIGSKIDTKENAITHCENQLKTIIRSMLSKQVK